jgi:hypothetical protein
MNGTVTGLAEAVGGWDGVSRHPHRFGGEEFRLGTAEIGHVHPGGVVDIPFPVALRERLVDAGRAEPHHVLPESGWTTVRTGRQGTEAALDLLRLSYLRQRARKGRGTAEGEVAAGELSALEARLFEAPGRPG